MSRLHRVAATATTTVMLLSVAGCGSSGGSAATDHVRIGFEAALTGTYQSVGVDMRDGFQLYLDTHGHKLGGRSVDLQVADEGDGAPTAVPAATRLIKQEHVVALAGIVGAGSVGGIMPLITSSKVPLILANGRPDLKDTSWVWGTSYLSREPGAAIAPYVAQHAGGPVWAIGPDYQGGYDELGGFTAEFTKAGGTLANPDRKVRWTPFPQTTNFLPYFSEIARSDAKAVYAFYAGKAAVDFVTQYAQSDCKNLPLYGAFMTEGSVLTAEGQAAKDILNVLNYSPDLDNTANRSFVAAWQAAHPDRAPTTFVMSAYDAAAVLDRAISSISGTVTSAGINQAISKLGQIDSPRGPWQFDTVTHSPIQKWYLRKVTNDGTQLANVVVQDLTTLGHS
jgi:branched-chain amino acid transport system substrate-binding protein